jgi:hypothetical protein
MKVSTRSDGAVVGNMPSAPPASKDPKTLQRIEIEPAMNGGASVKVFYRGGDGPYDAPEHIACGSVDEALTAVKDAMAPESETDESGPDDEESEEPEA